MGSHIASVVELQRRSYSRQQRLREANVSAEASYGLSMLNNY